MARRQIRSKPGPGRPMLTRIAALGAMALVALGAAPTALAGGGTGDCSGQTCTAGAYVPPVSGGGGGGGSTSTPINWPTGGAALTPEQLAAIQQQIRATALSNIKDAQAAACSGGATYVPQYGTCGGYPGQPSPGAPVPPGPDPATLAQQAINSITLDLPAIGSAPCTTEGCMGAVGVPVWLWINGGFPTRSATAAAGGLSVTVTATMTSVDWNLGDGNAIHCATPGTAYDRSIGWASSPDCGYQYTQPGTYPITATGHWTVRFTGDYVGRTTLDTQNTVQARIGEYQAIVTS